MIKSGAHRQDQNAIKKLADKGLDAGQISKALHIEKKCVESFMMFDPKEFARDEEVRARENAKQRAKTTDAAQAVAAAFINQAK